MRQAASSASVGAGAPAFWIVGHRGSPTIEVENTLASFTRAVDLEHANGLEIDLCVTRDEHVVVWHDFDPSAFEARARRWGFEPDVRYRPTAPSGGAVLKPTDELDLAELREHYGYAEKNGTGARADVEIPTLETFLAWATTRRELEVVFLDVKVPERRAALLPALLARLDRGLEQHRPSFRIVLETAYPEIVAELKRLAPRYDCALDVQPPPGVVCNVNGSSAVAAAVRHGLRLAMPQKPRSTTFRPFATHRRIVEADLASLRAHNAAAASPALDGLCPFTINERAEMAALVTLGVAGIQSDRPALLREVALAHGRATPRDP